MAHTDGTAELWTARLRKLVDPALTTYFNPARGVWVVDRCTRPDASSGLHTCSLACLKTNVLVLEEGEIPSDRTVSKLKSMDTWSEFGRENAAKGLLTKSNAARVAEAEANALAIDRMWAGLLKDDGRTLRQAFHLIQQHDCARVH